MSYNRIIMLVAVLFGAGAAHASSADFVGKWVWNPSKSSVAAGEPLPKSIVLDIAEASPDRVKWTLTATDPGGQTHVENFDGPSNGAATKVTGADDQTMAAFTLVGDALKAVFKGPGGASDSWACGVSADKAVMTCHGTEADGQGHSRDYTDAYDRR
jgi:hypothetical protein